MKRIAFSAYRRFFLSLLAIVCLAFVALMWKGALPGGATFARSLKASMLFMSKPVVDVHVSGAEIPAMALLNDEFCYTARISNTGGTDPGFAPYIRLITPVGVSLTSATLLNVSNTGSGNEQSTFTFTPVTPTAVGPLPIQDPLLPAVNIVPGTPPQQLWIIQPPIGSVVNGQSAIDIRICLRVANAALVNQQLKIIHQPVYLYGTGTIASDNSKFVLGDPAEDMVMPVAVMFRKAVLNAPVNDTTNGPAFEIVPGACPPTNQNATTFQLIADIATGVTLNNLLFNDIFPAFNNGTYAGLVLAGSQVDVTANNLTNTVTPGPPLGGPYGFSVNLPSATGIAGSDQDAVVEFRANVQKDFFANVTTVACPVIEILNRATFDATFNGQPIQQQNSEVRLAAKVVSLQKTASPALAAPGDTITYTLTVRVSEAENLSLVDIYDTLPDGISFVGPAGTLSTGATIVPVITGKQLYFKTYNNNSPVPGFGGCGVVTLTYQAIVGQNYANGQPVLATHTLTNTASIGYTRFTSGHIECYGTSGDNAASQVVISPANEVTKSIINNPLPSEFKPGDEVRFSLRMCIPSGDAKGIMFKDYLPAPFFDLGTVSLIGTLIQTPSGGATLIGPAVNTQDNSVMFTINPDPFVTNPTTPTCFEIQFSVKIASVQLPGNLSITNYLLAKTVKSDGTDDSHIAGVVLTVGQSNPVLAITKSVCAIGPGNAGTTASGKINNSGNVDDEDAADKLTYCITITNNSQATAHQVVFKDEVPAGLTYVQNSLVVTGAAIDTSILPPKLQTLPQLLAPGGMITVQYMATVNNTAAPCQPKITNTAKVEWASSNTGQPANSATETAEVNFAKPAITKTLKGSKTATIGETVTYEIKVCMPEGTATGVVITDTFPSASLTFDSVALVIPVGMQMTPNSIAGQGPWTFSQIIVPGNNITSDNCFTIEITGKVSNVAGNKSGTAIKNTVSMAVPGCPAVQSSAGDVTVVEPALTFKKEFVPLTAKPGQTVQVKLTITNSGGSTAYDAKVLDNLPLNLINPTGASLQSGFNLTITGQQVMFGGGTIPANGSVVLTFDVTAHVPCGIVQNTAAFTDASTLPGDFAGERKYPTITSTGLLNIQCQCLNVKPYLVNKNMVGWWPLDETTVNNTTKAADIAGFANTGSHINAAATPGLVSGALQFDGTSSYVNAPDHSDLNFGKGSFSIDAWVMTTKAVGTQPIVDKRVGTIIGNLLTTTGYRLHLENGRLAAQVASTVYQAPASSPNVADGNWHHVALSVSRPMTGAKNLSLYVDGAQVFSTASPNLAGVTTSAPLWIGRGVSFIIFDKPFFAGKIDEVELFKVALTEDEVKAIHQAGSAGKCKPVCALACPLTTLPAATVNQTYPLASIITGGVSAYSYDPVTLPPGMNLTASGHLTGTPTMTGDYSFSITATDQNGCSKTCEYKIKVVCGGLTITNPSQLPNGSLGSAYNQTLAVQNGCGDYVFKQISGTLPPGVILTSDGKLIGPGLKSCGTFDFTVKVTDKCGCMGTKAFSITIEGPMMAISDAYNTGVGNNKVALANGQLEPHYKLTANGNPIPAFVIPKQQSWVSPTNSSTAAWIGPNPPQASAQMIYTLMVDLTNCYAGTVQIGGKYAASGNGYITVNGGTTQYSPTPANGAASFTSFTLPSSSFVSNAINSIQFHVTAIAGVQMGLLVEFSMPTKKCCPCQLTVGPNTLPDGKAGTPYTGQQFTATGGTPPYTFQVVVTPTLPGVVFDSNGQISGTPGNCGDFTIIVKATDSQGCMGIRQYTLKINCSLTDIGYETNDKPGSGLVAQEPSPSQLIAHVNYQALGNEKAVRFSLGFDPVLLSNPLVTLGSGFQNAALELDVSQLDQGNLGVSVAMPDGQAFAEVRSELVTVVWEYAGTDQGKATRIEFKDSPVPRGVTDQSGAPVETQFKPSPIVLATKAAIVSAASYRGERLAPEEIVSAFGIGLATMTQIATTLPLPTTLAGTTIKVRDSANVERLASIFFVAPTQINYLIPAGSAAGTATVIITSGNGTVSGSVVEIANVAPGLFTADSSGRGLPAANALTFKADGTQSSHPVARFDPAASQLVAVPIDLGAAGDRVFLSLFGTGIRKRSSLDAFKAFIGGVEAQVSYAGDQGGFAGLDQLNIEIPRSLIGSGAVDVLLIVDGAIANAVQINIQ